MACYNEAQKIAISKSMKKYHAEHPEARKNLSNLYVGTGISKSTQCSEARILKFVESRIGGFWYGNVRNDPKKPKKYCELWTEDLKERIRAYWGYASTLSGKEETCIYKKTGEIKSISCHHVYYQTKACCIWDEDENGYYANINVGTKNNPSIIKYYIDGDPNKFVVLTASEHKKTDFNKLHWIKAFETIIEDQGGKCYFTKEEIQRLLEE